MPSFSKNPAIFKLNYNLIYEYNIKLNLEILKESLHPSRIIKLITDDEFDF